MPRYVLAIDQGTTSTRAILFDEGLRPAGMAQQEFPQHFPASGWVEHDPEDLWSTTAATCRTAVQRAGASSRDIAAIGITNQRETVVVWDRDTGRTVGNAIVWQDRRTAGLCERLVADGVEPMVTEKTGLIIDPYFSATKLAWILDNVENARERAREGRLLFGTVDSWLIWRMTGGRAHVTDATNASRTMLYDIHKGAWDEDLLRLFDIPAAMLPEVRDCAGAFGSAGTEFLGQAIPIRGVAGDQQAAVIGQACFRPGMVKSTYGTGCFALLNTGPTPVPSGNRLLTTVAYQIDGQATYALEGAIFVAGAVVQWLRDGLGLIGAAAESEALARQADAAQSIYLVPAFTGLGAPHWDPEARGAIFGLTRATGPAELARAALESVGYQTRDLLEAMARDWQGGHGDVTVLRVDGGMSANDWALQFLSDILGAPVDRPEQMETTALGAAYLAGRDAGLYPDLDEFAHTWRLERRFEPAMDEAAREARYAGWRQAVARSLTRATA